LADAGIDFFVFVVSLSLAAVISAAIPLSGASRFRSMSFASDFSGETYRQ